MEASPARISAVVLAYGAEPLLSECVLALLQSEGAEVDVVLVDNGCTTDAVDDLAGQPGVTVVRPGRNTGFAGGCNLGAAHATGDHLAFVNGDAVVAPDALAALARALEDPSVGLVSGSLRLYERPEVMNSAGNPVHYLGLSWAGGLGEPASDHARTARVASVTGAAAMCRRATWDALGGFCEPMFAYCEDADLSLRAWQRGWSVLYVPDAVVLHRYEFSRNDLKMYLLERNRLFMLLTLYERRTLLLLLGPMLALELAMLAVSLRQGWWRQKVRGWWWLLRHRRLLRERRAEVQSVRTVPDAELAALLTDDFRPGAESGVEPVAALSFVSAIYWKLVRRALGQTGARRATHGRYDRESS
ncbi:MAG TPA: glycosyltransferase family 2 protein [Nocardioidaceae bacterium]|nr:glycosyltransferase family 2 protein [Nocardioidaceae bacterium]